MKTESLNKSNGGVQGVYSHASEKTGTDMTFAVYVPPHEQGAKLPVVWYLSDLTCTHANVMDKGEYRRTASELGLIIVAPDTSPRGDDIPDDADCYDFGKGAGFYVDATCEPWSKNYRMRSYIESELPELIGTKFPVDMGRQGIFGHSMGGHGALTLGLRNPERFKSISAFAPICAPIQCPWGEKALGRFLGEARAAWREYDAVALIEDGARADYLLVDQGTSDQFYKEKQLQPELLEVACRDAGIGLTLNMREGYDHSYYFISTFMENHLKWHADRLRR